MLIYLRLIFLSDVLDVPSNENRNEDGAHHSMELLRKSVKVEVENYLNPSLSSFEY